MSPTPPKKKIIVKKATTSFTTLERANPLITPADKPIKKIPHLSNAYFDESVLKMLASAPLSIKASLSLVLVVQYTYRIANNAKKNPIGTNIPSMAFNF